MSKYLYGAAVQGIQSFIFQTNELKEIAGASILVEQICTDEFNNFIQTGDLILHAAGNIKCIYNNEEEYKHTVKYFPKTVMEKAPGITISQSVVKYDSDNDYPKAIDELENNLRAQRNIPSCSLNLGLMGIERSHKTGYPCTSFSDGDYVDKASYAKRSKSSGNHDKVCNDAFGAGLQSSRIPKNISDITNNGKNEWVAIIHADGNGLGKIVQKIGKDKDKFKKFSIELDKATKSAAQAAFKKVEKDFNDSDIIPIRPIVLSGDDFTAVCRGDMAIDYVTEFIKSFESKTKENLGKILREYNVFDNDAKLTACAGVAFIKSSYPFYYGYDLAEALCAAAKKDSKSGIADNELPQSSIMFHKVQDSFVEDYDSIIERELTPCKGKSWNFGPYYVNTKRPGKWKVDELMKKVRWLSEKGDDDANAIKSHLRQWMSIMHDNPARAEQHINRVKSLNVASREEINSLTDGENNKYPVYDILALSSIINLSTRESK